MHSITPTQTPPSPENPSLPVVDGPNLLSLIGKAFIPVHKRVITKRYDEFWLKGGRGSLKSSFTALEIVMGMMEDPLANAVATRKIGDTIRTSVMASFQWAIDQLEVSHLFRSINSPSEITYLPTGQLILMKGLDDPQKLKSIRTKRGYFKYLWNEEGAEYESLDEIESVVQSVLRGGPEFTHFVTYNPPPEHYAWINEEARSGKRGRLVHHSTYLDVDPKWLGPKFIADAEEMKRLRPEKYANVYLGEEIGNSSSIVFSGCYKIEEFEVSPRGGNHYIGESLVEGPYFGADWGFSQDPNVLVKVWIDMTSRKLYIEYEEFGIGVMLDAIPEMFDKIPESRRYKIRADCARPETIAHIKARGFNIEAAEKWPGSVEDGITVMKSFQIVVHPRCAHITKELRMYSYKIDKLSRDVKPDLVDAWNHGIDAIRYAIAPFIKKKQGWFA